LTLNFRTALPMLSIAFITLLLDQLTKVIIRKTVAISGTVEVIKGFFELNYAENTGAVFGVFRGGNSILIFIGVIAIAFVFVYYKQFKQDIWMRVSLGFILGGALGNLADRLLYGFVTDFIRIRLWLFRLVWWPNFNIADAAVLIGAIMMIISMFRRSYVGNT